VGAVIHAEHDDQKDGGNRKAKPVVNLISQAFGAAFAGMIANGAGFGNPALGSTGVVHAVFWLFLTTSLFPAAALPFAIRAIRLSKRVGGYLQRAGRARR
jgi:hypothetical protein